MTARRKGLVVLLVLVLVGLGGVAALVASDPRVRARYHLRRATAAEVQLEHTAASVLSGHALAFARSPVATELLPELVELAEVEATRDAEVCYRALVFEVTGCAWLRRYTWSNRTPPPPPRPSSADPGLLIALRSKDARFRSWALARIPLDEHALEAVVRLGSERPALEWLHELREQPAFAHKTDPAWRLVRQWYTQDFEGAGYARTTYVTDDEVARALTDWLEKNRSRLQPQLK